MVRCCAATGSGKSADEVRIWRHVHHAGSWGYALFEMNVWVALDLAILRGLVRLVCGTEVRVLRRSGPGVLERRGGSPGRPVPGIMGPAWSGERELQDGLA